MYSHLTATSQPIAYQRGLSAGTNATTTWKQFSTALGVVFAVADRQRGRRRDPRSADGDGP